MGDELGTENKTDESSDISTQSGWREIFILAYCPVAMAVVYLHGAPEGWHGDVRLFSWFGVNFIMLFVLPALLLHFVLKEPLQHFGMQVGDFKLWGRWVLGLCLLMLPVILIASRYEQFQMFYPRCEAARIHAIWAVYSALGWLIYFFAWEWFFRGFMLFGLEKKFGVTAAILIQTIPFAMAHFSKVEAEAWSSIPAGIALGLLAVRGRSFIGPWILHWLVAQMMDLSVILWPLR